MTGVAGLTGVVDFEFVVSTRDGVAGVIRGVGVAFFAEPIAPGFLPSTEAGAGLARGRALGFACDGVSFLTFLEGEPEAFTGSLRVAAAAADDEKSDSSSLPKSMIFRFLSIVGVETSEF